MRYCDHVAFFLMIQLAGEWAKTDAGQQALREAELESLTVQRKTQKNDQRKEQK